MNSERSLYDLLVIGGGINGVGIALDAAGRGLNVLLCEMNDLGSATSSNSSKLIHGGLRYLEQYDFRLVREALGEREILLRKAPHIIHPLRFRLPHQPHLRPAWMIRAGLFLYDHLNKRTTLEGSRRVRFGAQSPLVSGITTGFEYSDAWVDDARLVILNAVAARGCGADIRPRTRCVGACRSRSHWTVTLENRTSGELEEIQARALINAAGPWVTNLFDHALNLPTPRQIRLVKGSHIVVPRLHPGAEAYLLQHADRRIVFVIPYEDRFSLIGTTDVDYCQDPAQAKISREECDYLVSTVNAYFNNRIAADDVVMSFSGVRPLLDDASNAPQAATRDYCLHLDALNDQAPLLSVFGGKITTYRKLAETAVDQLIRFFPQAGPAWTEHATLPGGDFSDFEQLQNDLLKQHPWLPKDTLLRWMRCYGTLCHRLLEGVRSPEGLGKHFGAGLYQREVDYLREQEWAYSPEDILWRRSKLGLHMSAPEQQALAAYLEACQPALSRQRSLNSGLMPRQAQGKQRCQ